jgi:hypothetical protein
MRCKNCGAKFEATPRRGRPQVHCSEACKKQFFRKRELQKRKQATEELRNSLPLICDFCKSQFNARRKMTERFCSDHCKVEWHKALKRENNALKLESADTERICDHCGNEFEIQRGRNLSDQRFCNDYCKSEYFKGISREQTAQQRALVTKQCPVCEKDFTPEKTMKQKYCSKRCCYLFPKKAYATLSRCLQMVGGKKENRAHEILGYTPLELQAYIQSHPNWRKVKDGPWHLDHVFPIIAFVENGIKDIGMMCMLENLQPLSDNENHKKNKNYDEKAFRQFLEKHGVQC